MIIVKNNNCDGDNNYDRDNKGGDNINSDFSNNDKIMLMTI